MTPTPLHTPLHDWHLAHGANMAIFGGYDMPLWYSGGAKGEHLAAITGAALFDTSHMAVLALEGADARNLLQRCFTKDLDRCIGAGPHPLAAGRSVYGVLLDEQGHVLDDAIVFACDDLRYLLVVNASMGAPVRNHLLRYATGEVRITDLTGQLGKIDIQGPAAGNVLARVLEDPDQVFANMVYFAFKGSIADCGFGRVALADGTSILLSRTGYTGEFGFELFMPQDRLLSTWERLLAAGPATIPCGLAARDSLRAGAGLPLSHQDIGAWPFAANPWLFALPWNEARSGFTKEFIGRQALDNLDRTEHTLAFAGYDPRKIPPGEKSGVTSLDGRPLGTILTCATDMAIDRVGDRIISVATPVEAGRPEGFTPRGLCCGFIRVADPLAPGEHVLLTDGKRRLKVEIRTEIRPDRTARKPLRDMLA